MNRTACGDLVVEIDQDITAHAGHTSIEMLESLEVTFLGADEPLPNDRSSRSSGSRAAISLRIRSLPIAGCLQRKLMKLMGL